MASQRQSVLHVWFLTTTASNTWCWFGSESACQEEVVDSPHRPNGPNLQFNVGVQFCGSYDLAFSTIERFMDNKDKSSDAGVD